MLYTIVTCSLSVKRVDGANYENIQLDREIMYGCCVFEVDLL